MSPEDHANAVQVLAAIIQGAIDGLPHRKVEVENLQLLRRMKAFHQELIDDCEMPFQRE